MAHEVESMFSVRQVPWHGLDQVVQEAPDSEQARAAVAYCPSGGPWQRRTSTPGHWQRIHPLREEAEANATGRTEGGWRSEVP